MRARLGRAGAAPAREFVEAVVVQTAAPLGVELARADRTERECAVAGLVLDLLLGDAAETDRALRLRADPPLLAAFFQNIDLLYRDGFADADRVSALVMHALEAP